MVDARLPAEWLGRVRIDGLSDRAFRILAGALMWCNAQGTDGAVSARYTKYLHPDGDDQAAFDELEHAGIWTRSDDGYLLTGWSRELRQSTAAEVERCRESSRRRQQAYRERKRGVIADATHSPGDVPAPTRDVTRNITAEVDSSSWSDPKAKNSTRVTRNATRNAASPFCAKHPSGTTEPCGPCDRARAAQDARHATLPGLGWDALSGDAARDLGSVPRSR